MASWSSCVARGYDANAWRERMSNKHGAFTWRYRVFYVHGTMITWLRYYSSADDITEHGKPCGNMDPRPRPQSKFRNAIAATLYTILGILMIFFLIDENVGKVLTFLAEKPDATTISVFLRNLSVSTEPFTLPQWETNNESNWNVSESRTNDWKLNDFAKCVMQRTLRSFSYLVLTVFTVKSLHLIWDIVFCVTLYSF